MTIAYEKIKIERTASLSIPEVYLLQHFTVDYHVWQSNTGN